MKKFLLLFSLVILGCVKEDNNYLNYLNELSKEPNNCIFLYTLDTESSVYNYEDAVNYAKKQIFNNKKGNSFFIKDINKKEIKDRVIFSPDYSFSMKINVYDCSNI